MLLPAGGRVVTSDAVVCTGPGFGVVANGPEFEVDELKQ